MVKWENRDEGVFRFVESEAVAKMWGTKKCNPRMTYEKLSRAMRSVTRSALFKTPPFRIHAQITSSPKWKQGCEGVGARPFEIGIFEWFEEF